MATLNRIILVITLAFGLIFTGLASANDSVLPDRPAPQTQTQPHAHEIKILAGIQLSALTADGITTRIDIDRGAVEIDPVVRGLLGPRPPTAGMIAFGALEEAGCYYLARRMARSHRFHKMWWIPQTIGILSHGYGAVHNA